MSNIIYYSCNFAILLYQMSNSTQQILTSRTALHVLTLAVESYNALIPKQDTFKVDLQSPEGIEAFKAYMENIEELIQILNIKTHSRLFRANYTKAYRILYTDSELGYIPEIFDAAQEAFPYIWVNGQCYIFEPETIEKGERLVQVYFKLIQLIRLIYIHSSQRRKQIPLAYNIQLKERLQQYDSVWIVYEKAYIEQLIKIEQKSKETIIEALSLQRQLTNYQKNQRMKGKIFYQNQQEYHNIRKLLCSKIAKLNSVANINGKGRDDLSYEILIAAENVITKITDSQSKSIRIVAQKIRESFVKLRQVLKKFQQNLQMVDPQLKNNQPLVEALGDYQFSWEKGKKYFLEEVKQSQILKFSTILQAAKQKYPNFRNQLQFSDPCVFWMIPSIIVLNSMQGEDQGLAQSFINEMKTNIKLSYQYNILKQQYEQWKYKNGSHNKNKRYLYNDLQKSLLNQEEQQKFKQIVSKIKQFAISLQRLNPIDWNDMLSILLTEDV